MLRSRTPAPRRNARQRRCRPTDVILGSIVMLSRARVLCSASTLVVIVLALTGGPSAATAAQGSDEAALRASLKTELEDYLSTQGAAEHISAVSLRVTFRGDKPTINIPVGTTLYGGGEPLSKTNRWQIGSNTKAFTSVMLLQLEAEHKLSIHDTLGEWLPRYRAWRHVTIKRLLNMTSGIPDYFDVPFFRAYAADPNTQFSSRRLVSYAKRGRPTHGYSYSNTNYILAGMILRKATHDTYRHQLRKRIIKPLGLRTMTYRTRPYPRAFTDRLPAGYFFDTTLPPMAPLLGRDLRRFNLSYGRAAGGIVSSLKDATKWERALYRGRMLPRKQQRELESLVSVNTGKPIKRLNAQHDPQGYGLGVSEIAFAPPFGLVWWYEGETLGYRVLHFYVPRSGTLFAVAVNSDTSDSADKLFDLGASILVILHDAGAA
jgi:D-alanyl-D-alanine carboxypeptidase